MPFIADPTQEPASSWLNSPAVMLIGLIGSVISIIQAVVAVWKWAAEFSEKQHAKRRLSIAFAIAATVANAVVTPLTWTAVVATDKGDSHLMAELYPVMTCSMVLAGIFWVLYIDVPEKRWPSILAVLLVALGLTLPALAYGLHPSPMVSALIAGAIPSFTMLAVIPAALKYAKSKNQPAAS